MTARTQAKHACARCGKRQPADRMVFSTFTRAHYCVAFPACDRRLARNLSRAAERVTA